LASDPNLKTKMLRVRDMTFSRRWIWRVGVFMDVVLMRMCGQKWEGVMD